MMRGRPRPAAAAVSYGVSRLHRRPRLQARTSAWPVAVLACLGGARGRPRAGARSTRGDPTAPTSRWGAARRHRQRVPAPRSSTAASPAGRMGVVAPVSRRRRRRDPRRWSGSLAGERPAAAGLGRACSPRCPASGWSRSRGGPDRARRAASGAAGLLDGVLAGLGFGAAVRGAGPGPRRRRAAGRSRSPGGGSVPVDGRLAVGTAAAAGGPVAAGRRGGRWPACSGAAGHRAASCSPPSEGFSPSPRSSGLALPGVHRAAGRAGAARAHPPRPGRRPGALRGGRRAGRGGLSGRVRRHPVLHVGDARGSRPHLHRLEVEPGRHPVEEPLPLAQRDRDRRAGAARRRRPAARHASAALAPPVTATLRFPRPRRAPAPTAASTPSVTKWNVVAPTPRRRHAAWYVSTKTGTPYGGSSPHHPVQSRSHSPRTGAEHVPAHHVRADTALPLVHDPPVLTLRGRGATRAGASRPSPTASVQGLPGAGHEAVHGHREVTRHVTHARTDQPAPPNSSARPAGRLLGQSRESRTRTGSALWHHTSRGTGTTNALAGNIPD